jgi:hypothetical protein
VIVYSMTFETPKNVQCANTHDPLRNFWRYQIMADEEPSKPMTHVRGVGSRPLTLSTMQVKATSLGGTVEKLEMGMTGA